MSEQSEFNWFDKPGVRRGLWVALIAVCLLTILAETIERRAGLEEKFHRIPYFYALLGFGSCAAMIVVAKLMGLVLKARPDYYERKEGEADE